MVESAKANGVEPFAYLQRALVELPYLGKSPPMKNWRPLCPGHPASKRIVEFQIPMLIQIYILNNSRPWVWGLLSFGGDGELLSAYITTRTVRRKARTFRYMV